RAGFPDTAQAWSNASRKTRSLPPRLAPSRLVVFGATRHHLGASGPLRFDVGVPLLPGRPWGEVQTLRGGKMRHGAVESSRRGPPPLAGRDLHDTRREQTSRVATVGGRTSKRCRL